jgi:uncharacterized membrane protein YjjB (DUF3815 family)
MSELLPLIFSDIFWSSLAALGFAILFNVPTRALFACAFCGAVGHVTRTLLQQGGSGIELATLAGAVAVGTLSELFARRWAAPAPVFTVPAIIPMIPGTFAYNTMIGVLGLATTGMAAPLELLQETMVNAIKTMLILGALAGGVSITSLLFYWVQAQQLTGRGLQLVRRRSN